MNKKLLSACVAVIFGAGAGYALNAYAQAKPDVLVKQRQAAMTLIGKYWGQVGPMAPGKIPYDAAVVQRNAGYLDVLDKMPWDGFDASTKDEKNTKALPAVFTDTAKFKEGVDRLQSEVAKLVAVSKGGDEAAVKGQIAAVSKACGACHENFRQK